MWFDHVSIEAPFVAAQDDRWVDPSMNDAVVALRRVRDGLREGGPRRLPVLTQLTFDKGIEQFPVAGSARNQLGGLLAGRDEPCSRERRGQ